LICEELWTPDGEDQTQATDQHRERREDVKTFVAPIVWMSLQQIPCAGKDDQQADHGEDNAARYGRSEGIHVAFVWHSS
jgi:hypothetical protein